MSGKKEDETVMKGVGRGWDGQGRDEKWENKVRVGKGQKKEGNRKGAGVKR